VTFAGVICASGENLVPPGSLPNPGQSLGPLPVNTARDAIVSVVKSGVKSDSRSVLMATPVSKRDAQALYTKTYCD